MRKIITSVFLVVFGIAFLISAIMLSKTLFDLQSEKDTFDKLAALIETKVEIQPYSTMNDEIDTLVRTENSNERSTVNESNTEAISDSEEREKDILSQYETIYELNHDYYGWLKIEDTPINYPIMYTPWDSEYYLHRDFYGNYSECGVPFIDGECDANGKYQIIYGHHMNNGTMFGVLPNYADKQFYYSHKTIHFDNRYERREYEVFAAFYSQVYPDNEKNVFRYYNYKSLSDENTFNDFIMHISSFSLYELEDAPDFGQELIVLSTCNYHTEEGRFVILAKRVK